MILLPLLKYRSGFAAKILELLFLLSQVDPLFVLMVSRNGTGFQIKSRASLTVDSLLVVISWCLLSLCRPYLAADSRLLFQLVSMFLPHSFWRALCHNKRASLTLFFFPLSGPVVPGLERLPSVSCFPNRRPLA